MMYSAVRQEELANVLAKLASYPYVNSTFLAAGHTIAGKAGEGIVEGSPLTDFLFTPVYFEEDGFDMFQLSDKTHVEVLWATPIYVTERMFAKQHGWKTLVEGPFIEHEIQPGDLWRPAVVGH
jgi:hypothetical protein